MSFEKLAERHQKIMFSETYDFEGEIIQLINGIEKSSGKNRWLSIGRTDIEKGFMALRKGIAESYQPNSDDKEKQQEEVTHVFVVGNSPWDPR